MRAKRSRRAIRAGALALLVAVAGCDGAVEDRLGLIDWDDGASDGGGTTVVPAVARPDGPTDDGAATAEPRRIYYDLTAYDWYRQGEPLQVGGSTYQPEGVPVSASAERMRRIEMYRGVDVYVSEEATPPHEVVYVPVFRGYWQPFLRQAQDPLRAD